MVGGLRSLILCLIGMMVFLTPKAHAGAWTLPKGEGQIISTITHSIARRAFDEGRKSGAVVDFIKTDQGLYIEYGILDRATVVVSGALQDISFISREGPQQFSGLGTSRIGLRYGLQKRGAWVLAMQPSLVIPAGGETVPDADLGQGGLGGELRVLAGRNLTIAKRPGFLDVQAAFDYRSGDAPEQASTDVTLGVDVTPKIQVLGQAFAQYTTQGSFGVDQVLENDSLKLQASIVYKYGKRSALQLGAFSTVIGRNTVQQKGVSIGLWQRF